MTFKTREGVDYSTRDYEGFREDMINQLKRKIPWYTDFSQSDMGIVLIELLAHELDILSYYNDIVANEVYLPTARQRENVRKLVEWIGYSMATATPAKYLQVFRIEPQDEDYLIPKGTEITTKGSEAEKEVIFETDEDLIIPKGKTGVEVDEKGNYLYTVPITQGVTIFEEVVGVSDGTPDQKFTLGYKPVIKDSIEVWVSDGYEYRMWKRIDNFIDSDIGKEEYVIRTNEHEETYIEFGNGLSGKIPEPVDDGIIVNYRVGGGEIGNVAPRKITELTNSLPEVEETFNPYEPYERGTDRESNESAKLKAVSQLRTVWRAVTIHDFEDLALELPFVRFASAIETPEGVNVYVLPKASETLNKEQVEELTELYNERKVIGTNFTINSPKYKGIDLTVHVKLLPNYSQSEIGEYIEIYLKDEFEIGNYKFGQEVNLAKLVSDMIEIEGVRSVSFIDPIDDIEIPKDTIVRLGTVNLELVGGKK